MHLGVESVEMMSRYRGSLDGQRAQQFVDDRQRLDIDRVMPFAPAGLGVHQPCLDKDAQMLADGRTGYGMIRREVDDARRTARESPEQVAPDRICDRSEYVHD